jgi:hypothetical protein
LAGWLLPTAAAQAGTDRPPPAFVAGGKADQAEGARLLGEFRQAEISGTYWLAFELRVLPRKGDERTVKGELVGTQGPNGPLTRISVAGGRWLVQGGPNPAVWVSENGAAARRLAVAETLQPLAGTDLTLFDLQMPFLRWTDFVYEGVAEVRSRPSYRFLLYPPAELAAARPDLTGVRVYLDSVYQSLVQAELLGAKGAIAQSITLLDLKKVGDQWIPKAFDVRNNLTRDKTRFVVTAAALNLNLTADIFLPANLAAPAPAVPPGAIVHF